jgi:hypothetical protein
MYEMSACVWVITCTEPYCPGDDDRGKHVLHVKSPRRASRPASFISGQDVIQARTGAREEIEKLLRCDGTRTVTEKTAVLDGGGIRIQAAAERAAAWQNKTLA